MTRSTLFVPGRPLVLNRERTLSPWARAKEVREWRKAAWLLALAEKLPRYDAVHVEATPHLRDRQTQDVAACFPSVKAIIDGLVDRSGGFVAVLWAGSQIRARGRYRDRTVPRVTFSPHPRTSPWPVTVTTKGQIS